jgi:hypothetical protein
MAFFDEFPMIRHWAWGKDASKPVMAESKQHGYIAHDTRQLYIADNDRQWQTVSIGAHTHDASDITSGTLDAARIPALPYADASHTHDAGDVVSGTLDVARIPSLSYAPVGHDHTASDIDSESSTNGQVLTSNGSGGASWTTVSSGGGNSLIQSYRVTTATTVSNYEEIIWGGALHIASGASLTVQAGGRIRIMSERN